MSTVALGDSHLLKDWNSLTEPLPHLTSEYESLLFVKKMFLEISGDKRHWDVWNNVLSALWLKLSDAQKLEITIFCLILGMRYGHQNVLCHHFTLQTPRQYTSHSSCWDKAARRRGIIRKMIPSQLMERSMKLKPWQVFVNRQPQVRLCQNVDIFENCETRAQVSRV